MLGDRHRADDAVLARPVAAVGGNRSDGVDGIHAFGDLPEDGVCVGQAHLRQADEELASVGVGTR